MYVELISKKRSKQNQKRVQNKDGWKKSLEIPITVEVALGFLEKRTATKARYFNVSGNLM